MNIDTVDNFLRSVTAKRLTVYAVAVAVGLWAFYYYGLGGSSTKAESESSVATVVASPENAPQPNDSLASSTSEADSKALESRVLGLRNSRVKDSVDDLVSAIGRYTDSYEKWQVLMRELPESEAGKILGKDTLSVSQVMLIFDKGNASRDEYTQLQGRAKEIADEVSGFLGNNPKGEFTPATQTVIFDLQKEVSKRANELTKAVEELQQLIDRTVGQEPGDLTLREAIADYRRSERQREIDVAVAAREAVREENERKVLEAERERLAAEQKVRELEIMRETERLKAEAEVARAEAEAEKIAAEAKRQKAILEGEFERDWSKIQHYLGPLFIKTTKQPGERGAVVVETKESKPVSLSALKSIGLADPDISKACSALLIFFSYHKAGDRGGGPYPERYSGGALNPSLMATIRPGYDLLDKYGELLVEKGLLAP